jgi:ferritin-like metal-binding protein YciE
MGTVTQWREICCPQGYAKRPRHGEAPAAGEPARLEQVFASLDMNPRGKKCKAMEGLVREGAELMKEEAKSDVMDAALIAAAQRVEHYEMAGYGCARTYAKLLGEAKAATLLQQTLNEEGAADKKLTQIAKQINVDAEENASQTRRNGVTALRRRRAAR